MYKQILLLKTVGRLLWNKGVAILVLSFLLYRYILLPSGAEEPTPFAELFYAAILVASIIVIAPVIRLLVFPLAALLAETGGLREELEGNRITPVILHYWFATLISYAITALCVSSLL